MGGISCHSSSSSAGYNGCTSYPNDSVLNAGAIVGIVIGSLIGLLIIIFLLVIIRKILRKNNSTPNQFHHSNVYSIPMNMNHHQQSARRSEMYIPSKSPIYSEASMNNGYYENP